MLKEEEPEIVSFRDPDTELDRGLAVFRTRCTRLSRIISSASQRWGVSGLCSSLWLLRFGGACPSYEVPSLGPPSLQRLRLPVLSAIFMSRSLSQSGSPTGRWRWSLAWRNTSSGWVGQGLQMTPIHRWLRLPAESPLFVPALTVPMATQDVWRPLGRIRGAARRWQGNTFVSDAVCVRSILGQIADRVTGAAETDPQFRGEPGSPAARRARPNVREAMTRTSRWPPAQSPICGTRRLYSSTASRPARSMWSSQAFRAAAGSRSSAAACTIAASSSRVCATRALSWKA